jgi:hypothetical protein
LRTYKLVQECLILAEGYRVEAGGESFRFDPDPAVALGDTDVGLD